uniref:Dimethyladenosine transferase 2, mitochondrial n=1 Tax=Saccoglossus kowalevskii TaxID=10224 RepID=A0ABM0LWS8_SACKO|nr:PREDICTED: dimethyladenosine transferase 2, mitochondrial-like [Saccoglossus kowalevskii]
MSIIVGYCPGILTEELLKSGAPRVVALENQEYFLPFIGKLSQQYPNRLQCVYADVNRLDPVGDGDVFPPARTSIDLFQIIGAKPTEWESDPVVKVIHMVANKYNERALLLRNIFNLVNRFSWFQYGRIENYFLISHKDYKAITHTPKQKYRSQYLPLAVLHDMTCHVELLHTEPRTSFHPFPKMSMDPPTQPSQIPDVHLIKVTPRRDFFSYNLCRTDYGLLCFMVKQFMSKKSTHLMTAVENWAPGCGHVVTSLGLDSKTLTGDITGKQYFQLFLEICKNNGFDGSWLKEEALDFVDGGLLLSDHPSSSRSRYRYAF